MNYVKSMISMKMKSKESTNWMMSLHENYINVYMERKSFQNSFQIKLVNNFDQGICLLQNVIRGLTNWDGHLRTASKDCSRLELTTQAGTFAVSNSMLSLSSLFASKRTLVTKLWPNFETKLTPHINKQSIFHNQKMESAIGSKIWNGGLFYC